MCATHDSHEKKTIIFRNKKKYMKNFIKFSLLLQTAVRYLIDAKAIIEIIKERKLSP